MMNKIQQYLFDKNYQKLLKVLQFDQELLDLFWLDQEIEVNEIFICLSNFLQLVNQQPEILFFIGPVTLYKVAKGANKEIIKIILGARYIDANYLAAICGNIHADLEILMEILYSQRLENKINDKVIEQICINPNMDIEDLWQIICARFSNKINSDLLVMIASNQHNNSNILWEILSDKFNKIITSDVLESIASHPQATLDILLKILSSEYLGNITAEVLESIAMNEHANLDVLLKILSSQYLSNITAEVLESVAMNEHANLDVLWKILSSEYRGKCSLLLLELLVDNNHSDEKILEKLVSLSNDYFDILQYIPSNSKTTIKVLWEILDIITINPTSKKISQDIILSIISNPNANTAILHEVLYGKCQEYLNSEIIAGIAGNLNITKNIIDDLVYGDFKAYLNHGAIIAIASNKNTNEIIIKGVFSNSLIKNFKEFKLNSMNVKIKYLFDYKASSEVVLNVLGDYPIFQLKKHKFFRLLLQYKQSVKFESRLFNCLKCLPNRMLNLKFYNLLDFFDLKDHHRFMGAYDRHAFSKISNHNSNLFKDRYRLIGWPEIFSRVSGIIINNRQNKLIAFNFPKSNSVKLSNYDIDRDNMDFYRICKQYPKFRSRSV